MISLAAFLPVKIELVPSFSSRVVGSLTHLPGVVTPMAARKKVTVPAPAWASSGWMVALLLPPTWFHLVAVQV